MEEAPISVLVADDHLVVRQHVAGVIGADARLELIGEAGDGKEALRKVDEYHPDAVVLKLAMPVLDGSAVLRELREHYSPVSVLLLDGHAEPSLMREALRHQPDSLLSLADADARRICEELVAMHGATKLTLGRFNLERAQDALNRFDLSERQLQVLRLTAKGLSRAEIGEQLGFGASTVRDIRHDVFTKLGASSIETAIAKALRAGLLDYDTDIRHGPPSTYRKTRRAR